MEKISENEMNYTGLCVNCIHRDTCTLSDCGQAKVHCEEYECG
ncbi:MAG: hypothetical protein ACXACC_07635 [Promethearchaeota archaeon]|jgi:hypothetical protein